MIVDAVASKPPGNVDELKLVSGCLLASMGSDPGALDTNSADKISSAMDSMTKMLSSNASSNMGFSAIQDQAGTLGKMGGSAMQSSLAVVNQSKPDEVEAVSKTLIFFI